MSIKLLTIKRGKVYFGMLLAGGLLLAVAPVLAWLTYYLQLSGVTSEVWVSVTGFGSMFASSVVAGVTFSFPALEGWWYGNASLVIGIITLLTALIVIYNAELGGLIGFILSFPNMAPLMFFIGRAPQMSSIVDLFVQAIEGAGYTVLGASSGYALGFILEVLGTALLPISSILILSNATRVKMAETERAKRKPKEEEEKGSLPAQ